MVSAFTMTNLNEGLGIVVAANRHELPVVISFTLETDGLLPSGATLPEAIEAVDAATGECVALTKVFRPPSGFAFRSLRSIDRGPSVDGKGEESQQVVAAQLRSNLASLSQDWP